MNRLGTWLPLAIAAVLLYVPVSGWKVLFGSQSTSTAIERDYGAIHDVPGFAWVVVLNPDGVETENARVGFFEQCLIRYRGTVSEVTSHLSWYARLRAAWGDEALVEYRNPQSTVATGVLCPDGALFLLPESELAGFNDRTAERRAYEGQLAEEVAAALAAVGRTPRATAQTVDADIAWVEAVNPQGLESYGYRIAFLDTCAIEAGGTVQTLRETSVGTLYAYSPDSRLGFRGIGIPCPDNTAFLAAGTAQRQF